MVCASALLTHVVLLVLLVLPACFTHRLAAELEEEEVTEAAAVEVSAGAVSVSEEVLESLRGMEQQVQVALLELKKKDQQLAQEKSCTGRFKVSMQQKWDTQIGSIFHLCTCLIVTSRALARHVQFQSAGLPFA